MKRNLRYICAQPANLYYAWQVEVLIHNFMKMGVNPNYIDIVCSVDDNIPECWIKMMNKYNYVRFFFYKDTRVNKNYISSIRPNILKQHWIANDELKKDAIFYHDCDIIFTKPVSDWISKDMLDDENWYGSDCRWYISHNYIKSKGDDVLSEMCSVMNIDEKIIEENELNGIGAQYIMKNIDHIFWERVENDSENLFSSITKLNKTKKLLDPTHHELQIWCADMWALLWNAWKMNVKTICHPNLTFSWATSLKVEFDMCNIMHNAGVVNDRDGLFYKAKFINKLPYNLNLEIKKNTASYEYYDWVNKVGKSSVLI